MKADLSRDTFDPLKHYTRVLTQQGRIQLDADANEQAAIVLEHFRQLTADLIGPAAGPAGKLGFGIAAVSGSPSDFRIGFGHYYVNGRLCRADSLPVEIFPTPQPGVFRVRDWSADFDRIPRPPFELIDDVSGTSLEPIVVEITGAAPSASQIAIANLSASALANFTRPALRRVATYLHQPDYVYSVADGALSPPPLPAGVVEVYLDVWERLITCA
jgi:hypothetical protein